MNKTVLITGASRGVGSATAEIFAKNGYNIVINYLTSQKSAENLKIYLEKTYHVEILAFQADISKELEVIKLIQSSLEKFGKIDCLVNNACYSQSNHFDEKSLEEFQKTLNTNLCGPFLLCKHLGKIMQEQKEGQIINVASTNGIDTLEPFAMDYDASKAGLINLTHNFAIALAPYVRVNAVAPGWTKTESVLEMNPDYYQKEEEKILLNRFAEPEEIAKVIYFLSTNDASYINSSVIKVDGGHRN